MDKKSYKLDLLDKTNITSDIWQFEFEKPTGFEFEAGQYNEYHLPIGGDEDNFLRWFTISAAPSEDVIRITTRIGNKRSDFKATLANLTVGQTIDVTGPMGDFVLPSSADTIVMIAGGIGVTPYRSQIKELLINSRLDRPITLIYGARTPADFVFGEVFDEAERTMNCFRYIKVVVEPDERWRGLTGQITDEIIKNVCPNPAKNQVYVSGPEPMVDAFEPRLLELGFAKDKLHQDWFPNYAAEY